jgi:cytochrome P450
VLRHADVAAVSRQPGIYSSARGFVVIEPLTESQLAMMRFSLHGMDPPEHAKYRRMLLHSFTPRIGAALARLEARVFFEALLATFRRIERTGQPRRQRSNLNNALKVLPVRLDAA